MTDDRRKTDRPNAPQRRYEDAKAASASAAARIAQATAEAVEALRLLHEIDAPKPTYMWGRA